MGAMKVVVVRGVGTLSTKVALSGMKQMVVGTERWVRCAGEHGLSQREFQWQCKTTNDGETKVE